MSTTMRRLHWVTFLFLLFVGDFVLLAEESRRPIPTEADVSYGPDARNVLDFWKAEGDGSRPLLVYIHGGGWVTGDKSGDGQDIQPFLDKGISFAAINYRLTSEHALPTPVHDAAHALQFLRSMASAWNIDTNRIAVRGTSAGACTAMWLALHSDLADPQAADLVLRESTRVCAAAALAGQTSIDPPVIEGWLGANVLKHRMIPMAVGEKNIDEVKRQYEKYHDLYVEFSPINHVDASDPPLFMTYTSDMELPSRDAGHGIHHPLYGLKLKERSTEVGHKCHLLIPGVSASEKYSDADDFLFQILLPK
jgi:arylformamidase